MTQAAAGGTTLSDHHTKLDRLARWGRVGWGVAYVAGSLDHLYLAGFSTETYRSIAEWGHAPAWVQQAWDSIFMAHPSVYGAMVAIYEMGIGLLMLKGGRAAVLGLWGAIAFHVGLLFLGSFLWPYTLPALALLAVIVRAQMKAVESNRQ